VFGKYVKEVGGKERGWEGEGGVLSWVVGPKLGSFLCFLIDGFRVLGFFNDGFKVLGFFN
jgi:hypothetical protein